MMRLLIAARRGVSRGCKNASRSISNTCHVDREKQEILMQSKRLVPGADFFKEVADDKAMADAEVSSLIIRLNGVHPKLLCNDFS